MTTTHHLTPGMTISVDGKIYRVESCVKVAVPKGTPFIKAKLKSLSSDKTVEKSFKVGQPVQEVALAERRLEYLYLEGKDYLFLDVENLQQVLVSSEVVGEKVNFLKEGVEVKAMGYDNDIFSIELPQFLELLVVKTDSPETGTEKTSSLSNGTKNGTVETGATIKIPRFINVGDVIKVDTQTGEFSQRV